MQLEQFVSESLNQIFQGISDSKGQAAKYNTPQKLGA